MLLRERAYGIALNTKQNCDEIFKAIKLREKEYASGSEKSL